MIIKSNYSKINIVFEEFKKQCPWLINITEGCSANLFFNAYYEYSKDKAFKLCWDYWEKETRRIDDLRRNKKTTKKPCTGYFGMLVEWAIKGKQGDTRRETDLEEGDIKTLALLKRKNGTYATKEKPTFTKMSGKNGVRDVLHKTKKGLFYFLFEHSSKCVFDRKFLTIVKINFTPETKRCFIQDASYYQEIWNGGDFSKFNTHGNFLFEQGFYKDKKTQLIHLKQGGVGKEKMKDDGSYHMNFVLSTSVAKKIFIDDLNSYLSNIN